MKKFNKKSLVLLIAVTVLLTFSVSGTVAYLADKADSVTNTFTPTHVEIEIKEPDKTDKSKPTIIIHNKSNIKVFVRVAIVANWCDEAGNVVKPWTGSIAPGSGWTLGGDSYYYYNPALEADDGVESAGKDQTENLLSTPISGVNDDPEYDGLHLEVVVIQQSIQAEGMGATTAQQAFNAAQ